MDIGDNTKEVKFEKIDFSADDIANKIKYFDDKILLLNETIIPILMEVNMLKAHQRALEIISKRFKFDQREEIKYQSVNIKYYNIKYI